MSEHPIDVLSVFIEDALLDLPPEDYEPEFAALRAVKQLVEDIRTCVDQQAEDEGLWFFAQTMPEAYLQQELRALHALIETRLAPFDRKEQT